MKPGFVQGPVRQESCQLQGLAEECQQRCTENQDPDLLTKGRPMNWPFQYYVSLYELFLKVSKWLFQGKFVQATLALDLHHSFHYNCIDQTQSLINNTLYTKV